MSNKAMRISCLVIAVVIGAAGYLAGRLSLPEPAIWTVAAIAAMYAVAGVFGPGWLRWALLFGLVVDE